MAGRWVWEVAAAAVTGDALGVVPTRGWTDHPSPGVAMWGAHIAPGRR